MITLLYFINNRFAILKDPETDINASDHHRDCFVLFRTTLPHRSQWRP